MLYKKGDIGLGAIIVIIIIVIFLGWLVNEGWKECRIDSDCSENQYCTSQFECKDIPVIEKSVASPVADYNLAAWVVGLSLIVAALILKWDTFFPKKKEEKDEKEEKPDMNYAHSAEEKGLYQDDLEKD